MCRLGEDQGTNIIPTYVIREIGSRLHVIFTTPHSIVGANYVGRNYV